MSDPQFDPARLKRMRREAGLSQRQLDRAAGVRIRTIERFEQGRVAAPSAIYLARIAIVLRAPVEALLGCGPNELG